MKNEKIKVQINSEVGTLNSVILHKPGNEIEDMTPTSAKDALYSDILNLHIASQEYSQINGVLNKVTNVFYVNELLQETLENQKFKKHLIEKVTHDIQYPELKDILLDKNPEELSKILLEGMKLPQNSLTNYLNHEDFALTPLYNFYFMRDASASVFDSVLINKMANAVRQREAMVMESIFDHNPRFVAKTLNPETYKDCRPDTSMEGGDILIARKDVLVIGMGSRTTSTGIDYIAKKVRSDEPISIIVQKLPHTPESFIHLDMVFTFLDYDKCMIYEPVILNPSYLTLKLTVHKGKITSIEEKTNILEALNELGMPMKTVKCGGENPAYQAREQWHSGANFFAFAPGKVIGYERNIHTIEAMDKAGFEVVASEDVISGKVDIHKLKQTVVTIPGSELARGGGGARCMTMPVNRTE